MADRVIVTELRVDTSQFAADLNKITSLLESLKTSSAGAAQSTAAIGAQGQQVTAALGGLNRTAGQAANTLRQGFAGVGRNFSTLNSNILQSSAALNTMKSSASQLSNVLKLTFSGYFAKQVLDMADAVYKANLRLELATNSAEEYAAAQASVQRMTQETFVDVDTAARSYQRFDMALSETGTSAEDIAKAVEAVGYAARIAGSQGNELRSTLLQLTQAMQANRLGGDELRSLMENAPVLTRAFAKELQTTTGSLKNFGAAGKISSKVMLSALLANYDEWQKKNKELGVSFTEMIIAMKNTFSVAINDMFESVGLREKIGSLTKFLQENAGAIVKFLGLIAGFVALEVASSYVLKLASALKLMYSILTGQGLAGALGQWSNFIQVIQKAAAVISGLVASFGLLEIAVVALGVALAGASIYAFFKSLGGGEQEVKKAADNVETLTETMKRHQAYVDELNTKPTKLTYTLDVEAMKKSMGQDISILEKYLGTQGKLLNDAIAKQTESVTAQLGADVLAKETAKVRKSIEEMAIKTGTATIDEKYKPKKDINAMGEKVDVFLDPAAKKKYTEEIKKMKEDAAKAAAKVELTPIDPEVLVGQVDAMVMQMIKAGKTGVEKFRKSLYSSMFGKEQLVIVNANTDKAIRAIDEIQKTMVEVGKTPLPIINAPIQPTMDETQVQNELSTLKQSVEDTPVEMLLTANKQQVDSTVKNLTLPPKQLDIIANTSKFTKQLETTTKKVSIKKVDLTVRKLTLKPKDVEINDFKQKLTEATEKVAKEAQEEAGKVRPFAWLNFDFDSIFESLRKSMGSFIDGVAEKFKLLGKTGREAFLGIIPAFDIFANHVRKDTGLFGDLFDGVVTKWKARMGLLTEIWADSLEIMQDILNKQEFSITPEIKAEWENMLGMAPTAPVVPEGAKKEGEPLPKPAVDVEAIKKYWKLNTEQYDLLVEQVKNYNGMIQSEPNTASASVAKTAEQVKLLNGEMEKVEKVKFLEQQGQQTDVFLRYIRSLPGAIGVTTEELKKLNIERGKDKGGKELPEGSTVNLPNVIEYRTILMDQQSKLIEIQKKSIIGTKEAAEANLKLKDTYVDITEAMATFTGGNTIMGTRTLKTARDMNSLNAALSDYDTSLNKINNAKTPEEQALIPELKKRMENDAKAINSLYEKVDDQGTPLKAYATSQTKGLVDAFKELRKSGDQVKTIESYLTRKRTVPEGPFKEATDVSGQGYFIDDESIKMAGKKKEVAIHVANKQIIDAMQRDADALIIAREEINQKYYKNEISGYEAAERQKILQEKTKPIMQAESRVRQQEMLRGGTMIDTRANIGVMHSNEEVSKSLLDLKNDLMEGKKAWDDYSEGVAATTKKQQKFAEARAFKRIDIYTPENPGAKADNQRIEEFAKEVADIRAKADKATRGQYVMKLVLEGDVKSKEGIYALTKAAMEYVDAGERARPKWAAAWAQNDKDIAGAKARLIEYEKVTTKAIDEQDGSVTALATSFAGLAMVAGAPGLALAGLEAAGVSTKEFQKELVKVSDTIKNTTSLYEDQQKRINETDQEKIKSAKEYDDTLKKMKESLDPSEFEGFGLIIQRLKEMGATMPQIVTMAKELSKAATPKGGKPAATPAAVAIAKEEPIKIQPVVEVTPKPLMLTNPTELKDNFTKDLTNVFSDIKLDTTPVSNSVTTAGDALLADINRTITSIGPKINKFKIPLAEPVIEKPEVMPKSDLFQKMGEQADKATEAVNKNTEAIKKNVAEQQKGVAVAEAKKVEPKPILPEDYGTVDRIRDRSQAILGYGEAVREMANSEEVRTARQKDMEIRQINFNAALEAGKLSWNAYQSAVIAMKMENADLWNGADQRILGMQAGLQKIITDMPTMASATQTVVTEAFGGLSEAFVGFMDQGISASMQNFYDKFKNMIAKMVIDMVIFKNIAAGLQSLFEGKKEGGAVGAGAAAAEDPAKKQLEAAKALTAAATAYALSATLGSKAIESAAEKLFQAATQLAIASGISLVTGGGGTPAKPKMATGGIVTRATTALIGEAGPEAIIPLERLSRVLGPNGGGGGGGGSIGSPVTNITINNTMSDKAEVSVKETGEGPELMIEVMVERKVTDMFQGGTMDSFMRANYGLVRQGTM